MTVAYPIATTPTTESSARLVGRIEYAHHNWLQALREAVDAVTTRDTGIWPRWNAIRYVDTTFTSQFNRERGVLARLTQTIDERQATRLWIAGELVTRLRWQISNSLGLCHHAAEFSDLTARLLRAAEHWFAAVEETVQSLRWDDVPVQVREEFASLETETTPAGCELPVSLVTSL